MTETEITDYALTVGGWKDIRYKDDIDGVVTEFEVPGEHYALATKTVTSSCTSGMKFDREVIVTYVRPGPETTALMKKFGEKP